MGTDLVSTHSIFGWHGQLLRVQRWHLRLTEAAAEGSSDLDDFSYAFFQNCYHLREWVEKTSEVNPKELAALFENNVALRLCRDICNVTKHLTISKPSVDARLAFVYEYDPTAPRQQRLVVLADEKRDVLTLADECLRVWKDFLAPLGNPTKFEPAFRS